MPSAHSANHLHHHNLQYLILIILLAVSFFAFAQSSNSKEKQLQIAVVTAVTYFCWGIFHHIYDRDLRFKIVVEYAVIGLFSLGSIWVLLSIGI